MNFIERIIFPVALMGPVMCLPQVFKIWQSKSASGVSAVSWGSFALMSVVWLLYGIIKKEKPIIVMNVFLVIIQLLVVAGALVYDN